jgi:hypothetical protein
VSEHVRSTPVRFERDPVATTAERLPEDEPQVDVEQLQAVYDFRYASRDGWVRGRGSLFEHSAIQQAEQRGCRACDNGRLLYNFVKRRVDTHVSCNACGREAHGPSSKEIRDAQEADAKDLLYSLGAP